MTTYLPLLAGILGTLAMTLFTELSFRLLKYPYHVVKILANMLRWKAITDVVERTPRTFYGLATFTHYFIGVLFSYAYQWLMQQNILQPIISHAVLFGCIIGLIGITGWRIFFAIHPFPPTVLLKRYLPIIWLGHVVLAIVMFHTYHAAL